MCARHKLVVVCISNSSPPHSLHCFLQLSNNSFRAEYFTRTNRSGGLLCCLSGPASVDGRLSSGGMVVALGDSGASGVIGVEGDTAVMF